MIHRATKTYGHDLGLSCAFRQWRAASHCRLLHGYALSFRLEFEAIQLDANGWVIDFGALKPIKEWLVATFDHRTLVAWDDPMLKLFEQADAAGVMDLLVVERVGCEAFAAMVAGFVRDWLAASNHAPRVALMSVEAREHGANSAVVLA